MADIIRSIIELVAIALLLIGFANEDRIVAWEQKFWAKLCQELSENFTTPLDKH